MNSIHSILEQVREHFDAAGVVRRDEEAFLILGLGSTRGRDLDDFPTEGGRLVFRGWEKHMRPRLETVSGLFNQAGFTARPVGFWGYPGRGTLHLKQLAVAAGLGRQGKNTLVLDPVFGPWIRLAVLRIDAPLEPTGPGVYERTENPLCTHCDVCIRTCPVPGLLVPYRLTDPSRCLLNVQVARGRSPTNRCRMECVTKCPAKRGRSKPAGG